MTSPVLQALSNARMADQAAAWQRNETAMLATLKRQFGEPPVQQTPAMLAALSAFTHWCEAKGVPAFPAAPAVIAQFTLENASLGIDSISEVVNHIADMHDAAGLANPVATWLVNEAMDGICGEIEVPRSWPKRNWRMFNQMPCVLRRYLQDHEKQRDTTVRRAQNEAAMTRQQLAAIQKPAEVTDGTTEIKDAAAA